MNAATDALAGDEERMKRIAGWNAAVSNTAIGSASCGGNQKGEKKIGELSRDFWQMHLVFAFQSAQVIM